LVSVISSVSSKYPQEELRSVRGHIAYMPIHVMKIIDVKDADSVVYFDILDAKHKNLVQKPSMVNGVMLLGER
jgi:hypothetical protein